VSQTPAPKEVGAMVNSRGGGGGSKALSGHKRKEYRPKVQGSSSVVDDLGLAIIPVVDGT
jgi:hypothetical protein